MNEQISKAVQTAKAQMKLHEAQRALNDLQKAHVAKSLTYEELENISSLRDILQTAIERLGDEVSDLIHEVGG